MKITLPVIWRRLRSRFIKARRKFLDRLPLVGKYGLLVLLSDSYCARARRREKRLRPGTITSPKDKFRIRRMLFCRDGNKCFYCNTRMKEKDATIDHIKPISNGGTKELSNLRLIHDHCRKERDTMIAKGILKIEL